MPEPKQPSFGPPVAALTLSLTVFSLAAALGLNGVPNTETGLFFAMAEVVGVDLAGVTVASTGLLWVARLAGLAMLASLAAVVWVRRRRDRGRRDRGRPDRGQSAA